MDPSETDGESTGWTLLALVVDRSGSMETIKEDMERAIAALVEEQAGGEDLCLVTLTQFDDEFEVVADAVPAARMPPFSLQPRGGTALLDAVGDTIAIVAAWIESMTPEQRPTNVIFAVVTDGGENSSRHRSRQEVRDTIEKKTEEGWHFTFLGADPETVQQGLELGIPSDSILMWERSDAGTAGAMQSLSASSRRLRSGASSDLDYTEAERQAAAGKLPAPLTAQPDRPHLFLDVDGVLNVFEEDLGSDAEMFDDFVLHEVDFDVVAGYHRSLAVWLSLAMGARLAALPVDIHWVTTWEHRANTAIAPLCGLPRDLPVLTHDGGGEEWDLDWKFVAVRQMVERDPRPFVWIDDDLDYLGEEGATPRDWAEGLAVPSLLIAPDTRTGLLPPQLDAVDEFLRATSV